MEKEQTHSLGQFLYKGVIVNPDIIPDKQDAEKYRKAVDEMFKNLSIVVTLPRKKFPDIAEKAYYEQFPNKEK
ncbi:MAG: hypothetical protein KGY67_00705 [Candidatus Thermoplasmatota archaeon]|nr:hypothetical protein [Candidatus Thermoplasmatota archaeon]